MGEEVILDVAAPADTMWSRNTTQLIPVQTAEAREELV